MSPRERPPSPLPTAFADQPVDARRYLDALRRNIWLIVAITAIVTVAVLVISLELPKTYKASTDIVYNPAAAQLQASETTSIQRQLATFEALVQTPPVTAAAARKLSESPAAVKDAISASADPNANLLMITASARSGSVAAARANAVAEAFLSEQQSIQNLGLSNAQAQLRGQIARLQGTPGAATQIAALEARISALQIDAAGTASELQVAEYASPPGAASFSETAARRDRRALRVAADRRIGHTRTRSDAPQVHHAAGARTSPGTPRPSGSSLPSACRWRKPSPGAVRTRARDL